MGSTKRMTEFRRALDLAFENHGYDHALVGDIDDLLGDAMRMEALLRKIQAIGSSGDQEGARKLFVELLVESDDLLATARDVHSELDSIIFPEDHPNVEV